MTSLSFFIEELKLVENKICFICEKSEDDTLKYGDFLGKNSVAAHYFCLLFSPVPQNGEDNEGILGFLFNDITESKSLYEKQICTYCNKKSASIRCCRRNCGKFFHFICGYKNKCLYNFTTKFEAVCDPHYLNNVKPHNDTDICWICHEKMGEYNKLESIKPKCCKLGWFHKCCVMKFALNAGYEFHCIFCSSKAFKRHMRERGVYVPQRDPLWEKQPRAYIELTEKHNQCDLETCLCPNGKEFTDDSLYKIILCYYCGSSGVHKKCLNKDDENCEYICDACSNSTPNVEDDIELNNDLETSLPNNDFIDLDDHDGNNLSFPMPKPICYKIKKYKKFIFEKFYNDL